MFLETRLGDLFRALASLSDDDAWRYAVTKKVLDEIIRLNTEDQLEEDGIDSLGRDLGDYSPYTKILKKLKGQRTDHITLKDTGDFYESFVAVVNNSEIIIDADGIKDDGTDLFRQYGNDIAGLTDENLQFIINEIRDGIIEYIYSILAKY